MVYYILLAVTAIIFILCHTVIFPRLFFHARVKIQSNDRGISDIAEENGGRTIIYETEYKYRGIIPHYVLSQRDGRKCVMCEVDKNLRYIDYDIRLFNEKGEVFKILNQKEVITKEGYTQPVEIDELTAYASVAVNRADGKTFTEKKPRYKVSAGMLALYFLFCSIIDILSVYIVRICLAELFGGIYHESFIFSAVDNLITCIVCAAVILINVVATLIILKTVSVSKVRKGGADA